MLLQHGELPVPLGVICMVGVCGTTSQFILRRASLNGMEYIVES